jgi:outer membrane protein OmpA-like peptidoglycan-associated protein
MGKKFLLLLLLSKCLFAQNTNETITVFFDSNDFNLNSEQKKQLITFFSAENTFVESISIEGFCDDIGSYEDNTILSKKRANSVGNFMQKEFNANIKIVEGKGEIALSNTIPIEQERKNNRKVTLQILYKKIKKAAVETEKKPIDIYSNYKTFSDDLKVGDKIIIKKLFFKGGLTDFEEEEEADAELKKIVDYLSINATVSIEIQGHVCCISASFKDAYDKFTGRNNLSETRAQKIFDYLLEKGISSDRMTYKGYGKQFPIEGADEQFNKRVEILITKI